MTRDDALIIFLDMQAGALDTVRSMSQEEFKSNAVRLAQVASLLRLPVVLAEADISGPAGVFLPELTQTPPQAITIKHSTNNAWEEPAFVAAVQEAGRPVLIMAGRPVLIMAGLATDVGLCLTAASTVQAGHEVYAVVDVSGTLNARIEQAAWLRMMQAGVKLTSWTAFTAEIQGDYSRKPGPQLHAIIGASFVTDKGPFTSPAA